MEKKRILIAVLNWGLGHASRSIPLIRDMEEAGFEPVLASDGEALLLLQKEFPGITTVELPSYNITYPAKGTFYNFHFFLKFPRILRSIYLEKKIIGKIISKRGIHGIISDNRFGASSSTVPSVYITHQVNVLSGITTFFTSRMHRFFISKFDECWIPDTQEEMNLGGKMSHGISLSSPLGYLGIRSRFQKQDLPLKYDLTVLLSGPEPQRSILESIMMKRLVDFSGTVLFIRGKMEKKFSSEQKGNMKICNFMTGVDLEKALNQSRLVLTRPGFSTLLDLAILEKKAFFIPTPGQSEQEYLAKRMKELNVAPYCPQQEFSQEALEEVSSFTGFSVFPVENRNRDLLALFLGATG